MRVALAVLMALGALAVAAPAGATHDPWDASFGGDGQVTTDFGSNDDANDVVVQPDGKIVVAGTRGGAFGAFAVARYNTDGSLDASFSGDGKVESGGGFATSSEAYGVALQPDGKIVVAGYVGSTSFSNEFHLQRFNTDGSLDATFSGDGTVGVGVGFGRDDVAYAVAVQPDGKILAAGETCALTCDAVVMRFQPDGSLDPGFAGGIALASLTNARFRDVGMRPDGTVVAAGSTIPAGTFEPSILLARFAAGGTLLGTHFARYGFSSLNDAARGLAVQPNGHTLVAGYEFPANAGVNFGVARFDAAGVLDPGFSGNGKLTTEFPGIAFGTGIALQPDGRIVVVGAGNGDAPPGRLARYTSAGDLDPSFIEDGRFSGDFPASAVAIAPDGKIVVAGTVAGDFVVSRFVDHQDRTPPVLTLPGTLTAEATSAAGAAVTYTATATDNLDATPTVACTPTSGSTFALGMTTVSCTATDDAGNTANGSFLVRVVDTVAPTILAGSIRVNAESPAGAVVNYLVGVRDAVDPSPVLDCQPPTGLFPVGVTTVTCTARDASGNEAVRSFSVTVVGFPGQGNGLVDEIGALPLSGQADVRRDSAQQFCVNAFDPANWASNGMPRTNDAGRYALLQIRQCVLYLKGPPAEVATASAAIRLALIDLVCRIAHIRYDEVRVAPGANASRLVQAKTSLDQADAAPGTDEALFDCVNAWSILRAEPPQYTS